MLVVQGHSCKRGIQNGLGVSIFVGHKCLQNHLTLRRKYSSKCIGASISCSFSSDKDQILPSFQQLSDARVIYCVAAALGHNQESHPECSSRVPSIVSALEKMELTSKFRGSEVLELQNFKPASIDDIASVHSKAYVLGLEKAMDQASDQGIIFIDGSGPTYATMTTFQDSLTAAGAGITLVDSVVMFQPSTSLHLWKSQIHPLVLL